MSKIIGLNGKIGSGKGTVTKMFIHLCELNSLTCKEYFFAYKLKKMVAEMCNIDFQLTMTQEGKNVYIDMYKKTVGELLQIIGTILRKEFSETVWIDNTLDLVKQDNVDIVIFSDVRLFNEMTTVLSMGGKCKRIIRPNNDINDNSKRDVNHVSETELDNVVMDEISNHSELIHLYFNVIDLFKEVTGLTEVYHLHYETMVVELFGKN